MTEIDLLRKALLICAMELGYIEDVAYGIGECERSEEEALDSSIYRQYARPKIIAKEMCEKAKKGGYKNLDIAVKNWEEWYEKF